MKFGSTFRPHGCFLVEHRNKAGKLIGVYKVPNGIVDVGMEHILDVEFVAASQSTTWYIGLVDDNGWTGYNDADTMASHTGWSESVVYSGGARPQWTVGSASSRQVTNAATIDFSINASAVLKGIFIANDSTLSGSAGTLWATASFSSTVSVQNGDTLKITYTVSG